MRPGAGGHRESMGVANEAKKALLTAMRCVICRDVMDSKMATETEFGMACPVCAGTLREKPGNDDDPKWENRRQALLAERKAATEKIG